MSAEIDHHIAQYEAETRWDEAQAQNLCPHIDNCPGPVMNNVSHGPDGGGRRIFAVCRESCQRCVQHGAPGMHVSLR